VSLDTKFSYKKAVTQTGQQILDVSLVK
jgi:hypothetical protein